jgi:hypothetical protein
MNSDLQGNLMKWSAASSPFGIDIARTRPFGGLADYPQLELPLLTRGLLTPGRHRPSTERYTVG